MDIEEQYDRIYRYCYFRVRSRETAEDITQEAFLRSISAGQKNIRYIYTVARNLCIDTYRRPNALPLEDDIPAPGGEEETVRSIVLRQALDTLKSEDRELLLLRYVNRVRVSDLAALLGISRFALYRRLSAITKDLKEKLGGSEFYE